MKVNKVSQWVYSFLMLLPILIIIALWLYGIFTRTGTIENPMDFFVNTFNDVLTGGSFDFVEETAFYTPISEFIGLFGFNYNALADYLTYMVVISVVYLGIEVLLAFINIARKLVYAFVDKEF